MSIIVRVIVFLMCIFLVRFLHDLFVSPFFILPDRIHNINSP